MKRRDGMRTNPAFIMATRMSSEISNADKREEAFAKITEAFIESCRLGEAPKIAAYVKRFPQFKQDIEELFPTIAQVEQNKGSNSKAEGRSSPRRFGKIEIEQLNDFRIMREIGRGGMGVVFEALQESLDRTVAIKVLPKSLLLEQKNLARFQREAKTAASLHHTNIVPVLGVGQHDGLHYYVMQLIQGVGLDRIAIELSEQSHFQAVGGLVTETMAGSSIGGNDSGIDGQFSLESSIEITRETVERLHRAPGELDVPMFDSGSLSSTSGVKNYSINYWKNIAEIGRQSADALAYAHSQGVLHRDIKPANLMVDRDGKTWVMDFGLAKSLASSNISQTGDIVGTLRYMAPEHLQGNANERSDIYSLGITLYELVTLQTAFSEQEAKERVAISNHYIQPKQPRKVNASIPRDLETIILKATSPSERDRYQSASAFCDDLENFINDRPIHARKFNFIERSLRWAKRNPALATLSSAAMIFFALAIFGLTYGYVTSSIALKNEKISRQKAVATLDISLKALDRMFERFTTNGELGYSGGNELMLITDETALFFENLTGVYRDLSIVDSDDPRIKLDALRAGRRVGEIQQQLGNFEEATTAYEKAIESNKRLMNSLPQFETELRRELALVYNQLGKLSLLQRMPEKVTTYHLAAIGELQKALVPLNAKSDTEEIAKIRFETAESYYLLGRRVEGDFKTRSRGGRIARFFGVRDKQESKETREKRVGYLNQSLDNLKQIRLSSDEYPQLLWLEALCIRDRSQVFDREYETAIDLLKRAVDLQPKNTIFIFDLCETLSRGDLMGVSREHFESGIERLRMANEKVELIDGKIPTFLALTAEIKFKLAIAKAFRRSKVLLQQRPRGNSKMQGEITSEFEKAIEVQEDLVNRMPEDLVVWHDLVVYRESFCRFLERDFRSIPRAYDITKQTISEIEALSLVKTIPKPTTEIIDRMKSNLENIEKKMRERPPGPLRR